MVETKKTTSSSLKQLMSEVFDSLVGIITKPGEILKNKTSEAKDPKKSFVLAGIIVGLATLVTLVTVMIDVVYVKKYSVIDSSYLRSTKTSKSANKESIIKLENLKNVKYAEIIFKAFLGYGLIVLAVAGVYYLGGLIAKKDMVFAKLLTISSLALVPYIAINLILLPIFSKIASDLPDLIVAVGVIGIIYSVVIVYEGMNSQIFSEMSNAKMFINVACLIVLAFVLLQINLRLILPAATNGFDVMKGFGEVFKLLK